jgi:iron complex outermembrane recepter protein
MKLKSIALLAISSVLWTEASAAESAIMEEVVVTAQKREQSVQDVGIAITAFSGDQIKQLGFQNSIDIVAHTPGMTFGTPTAEGNNANLSLRGVALNDFNDNNESPVAVYIDDVYVSAIAGATFQLFDIERVEVLRGPQGTLFGRNASGGLAHFITKKPVYGEYEGYIDVSIAEHNQTKSEFALNAPLGEQAALRLSLAQNKFDGYVKNRFAGVKDPNDADSVAGRIQFAIAPSDSVDVSVNFHFAEEDSVDGSWQHQATQPAGALGDISTPLPANVDFYGTCPGCDGFGYRDTDRDPWAGDYDRGAPLIIKNTGGSVNFSWDVNESMTFTSITAVENYERYFGEDTDLGPIAGIVPTFDSEVEQFSQEFRLSGSTDNLRWVGGLYFFESEAEGTIDGGIVSLAEDGLAPGCNNDACRPPEEDFLIFYSNNWEQDTSSWSVFGQVEYDLSEAFTLIAGLRYTDEERDMEVLGLDLAGNIGLPGNVFADFRKETVGDLTQNDSDNITGKLELDWHLNDDTMLYGFVSRGSKAAGFNGGILDFQGVFNGLTPATVAFDEEILTAYEGGLKTKLWDGLGRLNISVFYYDYKDFQAFQFSNLGQIIFNTDATVSGGEIEFAVSPTERLDFLLGVGFINEANAEDIGSPAGAIRDRDMVLAPELQLNTIIRYNIPVGEGNLALQWDGFYQTEQWFDLQNHPISESDAYAVWNAKVMWTSGNEKWNVTGWVNNVFEEEYLVYTFDFTAAFGYNQLGYGRPRWAGVTVGYQW